MAKKTIRFITPLFRKTASTALNSATNLMPRFVLRLLPKNMWGDRLYAFGKFVARHGRLPDKNTFNGRLYYIKTTKEILDPLRVFITDKENVKLYIAAIVGDEYNVPTLSVLRSDVDIDNFSINQSCVLKPTHSTGKVIFHYDGDTIDRNLLKQWLKHNYYHRSRAANYKYLMPKIIVEPMLFDRKSAVDFKVFCINSVSKLIKVDFDRHIEHVRKFYDTEWNPLPFSWNSPPTNKTVEKPPNLDEMLRIANRLSERLSFVRIDFYIASGRLFVGEITNCDGSAGNIFYPRSGEQIASEICFQSGQGSPIN